MNHNRCLVFHQPYNLFLGLLTIFFCSLNLNFVRLTVDVWERDSNLIFTFKLFNLFTILSNDAQMMFTWYLVIKSFINAFNVSQIVFRIRRRDLTKNDTLRCQNYTLKRYFEPYLIYNIAKVFVKFKKNLIQNILKLE